MAKDHMILAVNYNRDKFPADYFPVAVTEKYDGVACRFSRSESFDLVTALSRQQETIASVEHIQHWLRDKLPFGVELIGELVIPGIPFKGASGIIRRNENDPRIQLMIYDYVIHANFSSHTYYKRMEIGIKTLGHYMTESTRPVHFMPTKVVNSHEEIEACRDAIFKRNPKAEGLVIRPLHHEDSIYRVGRSKGLIRWKPEPTIDLRVMGFEEAVSKDKRPLGMVGRVQVYYKGEIIGAGPGKLTHDERRTLWENRDRLFDAPPTDFPIAEFKYMRDDSYTALRQPTFQRWRPDKLEPDA